MKIFKCSLAIALILAFSACSNSGNLKPPKKSPCACYDLIVDMENV